MLRLLLPVTMLCAIAGCSAQDPKISAHDGWARETGESDIAAAYVTIENKGSADRLTGVRSSIGEATLHETSMDDGVMRMRQIDAATGLVIPSSGKLALAPGGAHVMLMGLKQPLKAGDRFNITLQFAKSGSERVDIIVKPTTENAMAH